MAGGISLITLKSDLVEFIFVILFRISSGLAKLKKKPTTGK